MELDYGDFFHVETTCFSFEEQAPDLQPGEITHEDPAEEPQLDDIFGLEQTIEMDDDEDDRKFSKGIVFGFVEQAETTFKSMDKAL